MRNRFLSLLKLLYYLLESCLQLLVPKHQKDVTNQIVLITGGGSGIGQLMALRFLKLKCKVVVWDINEKGLETTKNLANELNPNCSSQMFTYQIDLTNRNDIYKTAKLVKEEIGSVDILINNAGHVCGKFILDLPDSEIEQTFKVNIISNLYTIKAFLPDMIDKKRGHIVSIASTCSDLPVGGLSDYTSTKFAVDGMDQSLRFELAKYNCSNFIKTTIVKPWLINTGMFAGANPGFLPMLEPEFVANQIVNAILEDCDVLYLPKYIAYLIALYKLLPLKCKIPIYDFMGGFESMDHFVGRNNQLITHDES